MILSLSKCCLIVATLVSLTCSTLAATRQSDQPNVVILLVDDLGCDELACYASRFHDTPHIDAFRDIFTTLQ